MIGTALALLGTKVGVITLVGVIGVGAVGGFIWHKSALADAKQQAEAETRSEVVKEQEAIRRAETVRLEGIIDEKNALIDVLAKRKNVVTERIIERERVAEEQRNEVDNKPVISVIADSVELAIRAEQRRNRRAVETNK